MEIYDLIVAIFVALLPNVLAGIHMKSIECRSLDKTFADFEYCYLKAVNRSYKYISLKVNLFKVPINNVSIRFAFKKRANGYKPFLYDVKFDACRFLRERNNPLNQFFLNFFQSVSNMNHTCPYDHDLIVDRLDTTILENQMVNGLPFPKGDYGIVTTWFAYNIERAVFNAYFTIN